MVLRPLRVAARPTYPARAITLPRPRSGVRRAAAACGAVGLLFIAGCGAGGAGASTSSPTHHDVEGHGEQDAGIPGADDDLPPPPGEPPTTTLGLAPGPSEGTPRPALSGAERRQWLADSHGVAPTAGDAVVSSRRLPPSR